MPSEETKKQRLAASKRGRKVFSKELPTRTDRTGGQNLSVAKILAEYRANGTRPVLTRAQPLYGDGRGAKTLQAQMEAYHAAKENFDLLPATVREAAENDMIKFVGMIENPSSDDGRIALAEAGLEIEGWEPPSRESETDRDLPPQKPPAEPEKGAQAPPSPPGDTPPGTPAA